MKNTILVNKIIVKKCRFCNNCEQEYSDFKCLATHDFVLLDNPCSCLKDFELLSELK